MRVVYKLRKDSAQIERIQNATLHTTAFGIRRTHGLFGSDEWWSKITIGELKTHTLRGFVSNVYMGSMNDWPEFEVTDSAGKKSQWTREVNEAQDDSAYVKGRLVEIDYVIQWFRGNLSVGRPDTKCVIEIRIEE